MFGMDSFVSKSKKITHLKFACVTPKTLYNFFATINSFAINKITKKKEKEKKGETNDC